MEITYKALIEYNSFNRESSCWLIKEKGNEKFLELLYERIKLAPESGFTITDDAIDLASVKVLTSIGNNLSTNCGHKPYCKIDEIPASKTVELRFIDNPTSLIKFLTKGRFRYQRETSKV